MTGPVTSPPPAEQGLDGTGLDGTSRFSMGFDRRGALYTVLGLAGVIVGLIAGQAFVDPLLALLAVVPGVSLAFFGVQQALMTNDSAEAHPPSKGRLTDHGSVAILLTTVTLLHDRLGIDGIELVIAAAWFVLLGHAIFVLAGPLGLQVIAEGRRNRHLLVLPLVVHLAIASWAMAVRPPDGDEPYYLLLAHSLMSDLDVDLADEYSNASWERFIERPIEPQPGDPRGSSGAVFSRHGFFLPLLMAPFYALGGRAGAAILMALIASATAFTVAGTALRVGSQVDGATGVQARGRAAFLTWAIVGLTPPLLLYSHQIWVEVPAALALAVAVDRIWRLRAAWRDRHLAILAAALVSLVALKLRFGLLVVSLSLLAGLAFHRRGAESNPEHDGRRWLAFAGIATLSALAISALLVRNQVLVGNPLRMHQLGELAIFDRPLTAFFLGVGGLFFDCAFGLFAAAPIWLLLVPALIAAILDSVGRGRTLVTDLAIIGLPYLAVLAPRLEWYGGWSPPFRYAMVLLPILALTMVPLLGQRRSGVRVVGAALGLVSVLLAVLWMTVPGWTYNLADGGNHLLDSAGARIGADLGRLFPSMVRPRLASWLWPLAAMLLACLALTRRPPRRAGLWGVGFVLGGIAILPIVATALPTRTIELEDGYVRTRGGHLSPRPWTLERPRYRGGWTLRTDSRADAPVKGQGPVRLRLAVRFIINGPHLPLRLDVHAGDQLLASFPASAHQVWQIFDIEDALWPLGADLTLIARGERKPGQPVNGVIVDYVDFHWQ